MAKAEELLASDWQPLPRLARYEVKTQQRTRPVAVKEEVVRRKGYTNIRTVSEEVAQFVYRPVACKKDYRIVVLRKNLVKEKSGGQSQSFEMTFERLVASLYMTAMLQLGLMAPEGEQPRADILGARQTIDTLGVLQEKTKGNLTPQEQTILQQSLFELRMTFLELTNAITRPPNANAPAGGKK